MTLLPECLLAVVLAAGTAHERAEEAVRLARAGAHEAALERFRTLAADNPRDVEARVWIARLLMWTGREEAAERELRQVLAGAPDSVDALLGLGSLVAADGRTGEALDLLTRAERLHPGRPDTLAALGRTHRLAGTTTRAVAYYQRAAALAPHDADIRRGLEITRHQHAHRVSSTMVLEQLSSSLPGARSGGVDLNVRATDRLRLGLSEQVQRKFGRTESRTGASIQWRSDRRTVVTAAMFGTPRAEVLPRQDVAIDVERSASRADVVGGLRFIRFSTASAWVMSPGAVVPLSDRLMLLTRYYASWTAFEATGRTVVNHSFRVALRSAVRERLSVEAGYAHGNESFEAISVDRIGRFRADTVALGLRIDTRALSSVAITSELQRANDRNLFRVTAGVTQRF